MDGSAAVMDEKSPGKGMSVLRKQRSLAWSVTILLIALIAITKKSVPPPELVLSNTFTADEQLARLPPQCQNLAKRFYSCQSSANDTIVFACHRKWCSAFGHCTPCGGLGDRTRNLLFQTQQAADQCRRVALDYPLDDFATLDSAVYTDSTGWLGELFHYRSYDISERKVPLFDNSINGTQIKFSHFSPHNLHGYRAADPCYFHLLFTPTPNFQREVDRHATAIGNKSIGLHFRTGDSVAFGISNKDVRVKQVQDGWNKMLVCADELAEKLFGSKEGVTFFLATDNVKLKTFIQQDQNSRTAERKIYTTETQPVSFLRGLSEDRDAWIEMFLLSGRQGMVVNSLPADYQGSAGQVSFFSVLAKSIGFLSENQVSRCRID